ncbi:MAG TPA: hypothetical protein VMV69_04395 [Pirellulales bacterium]|nr:hypothetical protein [Pirellulales bacterium]
MRINPAGKVRVEGDLAHRMRLAVKCLDRATPDVVWNGLLAGEPLRPPAEDGLANMRVLDRIALAARRHEDTH